MAAKRKMQNVSFKYVEEFYDFLPEEEFKIVDALRKIIYNCVPDVTEKLAYNVPFFYRHKRICFIWPPSVLWGNVRMGRVQLGFVNGYLLHDEINYLEKEKRKQIYCRYFSDVKEIDVDLLKSYIFQAVIIDEELARGKKQK